jgi:hypothetical protein
VISRRWPHSNAVPRSDPSSPRLIFPDESVKKKECHPERSGGLAREAAAESKDRMSAGVKMSLARRSPRTFSEENSRQDRSQSFTGMGSFDCTFVRNANEKFAQDDTT